jgi:hypothetical protein
VPKLMDFFAVRIVRRLHRRTVLLATVSLVGLGITALATPLVMRFFPSLVRPHIRGTVQTLVQ